MVSNPLKKRKAAKPKKAAKPPILDNPKVSPEAIEQAVEATEDDVSRKASAPLPPAFAKGDRVTIRPTQENRIARKGRVEKVDGDTIHVRTHDGYVVRFRDYQLLKG